MHEPQSLEGCYQLCHAAPPVAVAFVFLCLCVLRGARNSSNCLSCVLQWVRCGASWNWLCLLQRNRWPPSHRSHPYNHPPLPQPCYLYTIHLNTRILWEAELKALVKSRLLPPTVLPSSTKLTILSCNAVGLVRHDLHLVSLCWVFPVTLFSLSFWFSVYVYFYPFFFNFVLSFSTWGCYPTCNIFSLFWLFSPPLCMLQFIRDTA